MADDPNANGDQVGAEPEGFKPITSQDELNRIIGERVKRAKPADYDDLKAKAAELDKIQAASKSEADKTAERIASLERDLEATRSAALRSRVQARFGISDEDAGLFLTATDEDTLVKQAQRLAAVESDRKKHGNRAPLQGRATSNSGTDNDEREFVRQLFGKE